MLEGYYPTEFGSEPATEDQRKRLLVVQAALEIAKASAGSASGGSTGGSMYYDLQNSSDNIGKLADAIQAAIEKE